MSVFHRRVRDPIEIVNRRERLRQFEVAQKIFKLPEGVWEDRVQLLPPDQRPSVRRMLEILKEHRSVCA